MKKTFLVLSILLMLFAGGVWGDYWDYDGCGHDQKPCLTKEGNLIEGRYEKKIGPIYRMSVDFPKGMLNGLLLNRCGHGARPDGHLYVKANFKEGKFFSDSQIKNILSKSKPFDQWTKKITYIDV